MSLYSPKQGALNKVPTPEVPVLTCDAEALLDSISPVVDKPLTFQTKGIGNPRDITLIPFYQMHHQRYSVYWSVAEIQNK